MAAAKKFKEKAFIPAGTETTTVPLVDETPLAGNEELQQAVARAAELTEAIDTLKAELARVKEEDIESALLGAQVKTRVRFMVPFTDESTGQTEMREYVTGVVFRKGSTRIERKKLVKVLQDAGIDPLPIVEAASVTGSDSVYLWFGRANGEGSNDGDE